MKTSFLPKLVNAQTGDPALFIDILREKRGLLFDCGVLNNLAVSELLRISDLFISHTHIDHFIGFDHLLRLHLGRGRRVRVFGPRGITGCVRGKLAGYTWNLVRHQRLVYEVHEFDGRQCVITEFVCRRKFRTGRIRRVPVEGPLWRDPWIQVQAAVLDHKIPCLAYRLTERDFYNVDPVALEASGLRPGPWLNELKHWVRAGRPAGARVRIDDAEHAAAPLADRLLIHSRGRRIGYVADAGFTPANQQAIVELMRDVDLLYCEGAFLEADAQRAAVTHHLTARQAGELARRAGAGRLVVFHFSPKYEGRFEELEAEAQAAFAGRPPPAAGITAPG